jgi:hypothetical protein
MQALSVIQMPCLGKLKETPCILGVLGLRNLNEEHAKSLIKSAYNSDIGSLSEVEINDVSEEK